MKILLISTLYSPYEIGGAERSTRLIAQGYRSMGYDVEILTTSNTNEVRFVDGIKVHYLKFLHIFWRYESKGVGAIKKVLWRILEPINILNIPRLRKVLKDISPAVIHTNNIAGIGPVVWRVSKRMNIRVIHTARDYYLLCAKSGMYRKGCACSKQCMLCSLYTLPYRSLSGEVDAFVGVSSFVKDIHLKSGYFQNANFSTHINNIFKGTQSQLSLNNSQSSTLVIGCIGYIRETKGINQLIDALDFALDIKLVIAGSIGKDDYSNLFLDKIKGNRKIDYLGHVDPNEFYPKIQFLIHPAVWHEPFPRVLIEAFSYGIPVIAGSTGGTKEAIEGLSTGFVYTSMIEINGILNQILKGKVPIDPMKENCKKYAERNFTSEVICNKYLALINTISD